MATAAERNERRCTDLQRVGCIACYKDDRPGEPGDVHHIVDKGYRKHSGGHEATLCLCKWHHVGQPAMGFSQTWMTEKYGPSLAKSKRDFTARYGTERELLAETNRLIGIASRKAKDATA